LPILQLVPMKIKLDLLFGVNPTDSLFKKNSRFPRERDRSNTELCRKVNNVW